MHLLNLSFVPRGAGAGRLEAQAREIATKQLVGIAGVAAERIHRALGHPRCARDARAAPAAQPGGVRRRLGHRLVGRP